MSQKSAIISDPSDLLFYAALMLLPVDGTVAGIPLPYWTPLSPWLFLAYALVNARLLRTVARRYLPFVLFPLLLVLLSFYGWTTIGFHGWAAARSIGSVVLGLACLASLEIALRIKRLPWKPMVTVLVATYSCAFVVGAVQWAGVQWHVAGIRQFFARLMYRNYTGERPQFLFAEPSYIGMHLFGVLLPVYWLTRDRRVAVLVPVFAVGSLLMGAGTRIVIDSVVAGVLWLVASINFRRRGATIGAVAGVGAVAAGAVAAVFLNPRLNKLATDGLLNGDQSMSARIFHMLAPAWAWKHDLWHTLFGWGVGNISNAVRAGYWGARRWYDARGGLVNGEIRGLENPPTDAFTMSAYVSFITEFGALAMLLVVLLVVALLTVNHAWNRTTVCWLVLVAYLYVQFEAYGFYALVLLVWGAKRLDTQRPDAKVPRLVVDTNRIHRVV
ncbi:hypothetical protein [Bifidobacterium tibiigranuli]|jgi:hypothetical protein|uniref:hypothetical protein n=1 Tax=Bifidobacterium tibiigranuli TaxID=2172043 RepID=UPI0026ED5C81|nr:hypothetical protein [Bifidobacterium tibiigranuli]MCI1650100.1 hypothetical protein [Bifidobacterium tibiigranuli]MCI1661128.1 hypothetical protein [Bifidobacterium psychraerophilum]MCI2186137.1 hypothetical protein [Bifidobacterium tibiigranuli]MCI2204182.1 hypothetical protein [Bifidobacterium tibiigranuli]